MLKYFIKDYKNVNDPLIRKKYGILSSVIGIIVNTVLFLAKFIVGSLVGSISLVADGINNLSDTLNQLLTIISFKIAAKPADKEHPYGHERIEYVISLVVALFILFLGFETALESIKKIINPTDISLSINMLLILAISIIMKIILYYININFSRKINSIILKTTAYDSLSDILGTSSIVVGFIIFYYTNYNIDSYIGLIVSVIIMINGIKLIIESTNKILGEPPSPEFVENIIEFVISYDGIIQIHDLMVHMYGENRTFVTLHAEVSRTVDVIDSHELIDKIEEDAFNLHNINLLIHMDPVQDDDLEVQAYKNDIAEFIKTIDETLTIHDFRVLKYSSEMKFIFDIDKSSTIQISDRELTEIIQNYAQNKYENVKCKIKVDLKY